MVGYSPWDHKKSDMIEHKTQAIEATIDGSAVIFTYFANSLLESGREKIGYGRREADMMCQC